MMEQWNIGYKGGKDLLYKIDRIHSDPLSQSSDSVILSMYQDSYDAVQTKN